MTNNFLWAVAILILGVMTCTGIYGLADTHARRAPPAASGDSEVAAAVIGPHTPPGALTPAAAPCPPGADFCPAPGPPQGFNGATAIGQLVQPTVAVIRIFPADGEPQTKRVKLRPGVWLIPEAVFSNAKEVAP